ncbi:alternative sulfate transporter [Colletotrichum asianum]|uniref:Alternative sulfate transporter n=1 Tax=Colletotrichum asianum TaxID=702518 RepID=A0A8H3W3F2_9PEZI|nr:alternative sulfate transporter [Colletotrichum asianum]
MVSETTVQYKAQNDGPLNVNTEAASKDQPCPTTQPVHIDWTHEEERWAKRKFDWMGPCLEFNYAEDLKLNRHIVVNGQTCLYIMIAAFELPSNLLLQHISVKLWIPCQMNLCGLATLRAETKGTARFYGRRIFLGITEAGFISGSVCLHHHFGLMAALDLRYANLDPYFRLLTPREEHILNDRIVMDNQAKKNASKIRVAFKDVVRIIANWRLLTFLVFITTYVAPITCMDTYNSQITKEIDFDTIRANLLVSVSPSYTPWVSHRGYAAANCGEKKLEGKKGTAIPLVFLGGNMAAANGRYGMCMPNFQIPDLVLSDVSRHLQAEGDAGVCPRCGVSQIIIAVACPPHIQGLVWVASNTPTPFQPSVYSVLYVMLTNESNSFAAQTF